VTQRLFHKTNLACLAVTPIAIAAHPSLLSLPIDLTLSILFPLHAHIGMNWIITDYVPVAKPNGAIRMALLAVTGVTVLGLLRLSIFGDGLVGTLKATWQTPDGLRKKREEVKK